MYAYHPCLAMEGIHVRDDIETLRGHQTIPSTILMGTFIPSPEGMTCVKLRSDCSSLIRIWFIHEPKKRCQASHRLYNRSSVHFKRTSKAQTSERFQIWCKGTTNEEAEGEKLLSDKVGLKHSMLSRVLATKKALASDRSDA